MPHYVAFLGAINVGGRTVRMERLREVFSSLGFADVETFIASGNVIFHTDAGDTASLEARIETALQASLGYPVIVFIRRAGELDAIARHEPFAADATPGILHVGFLRTAVTAAARRKIRACGTDVDQLDARGREIYWLVRGSFHDSKLSGRELGRITGPTTMRNRNTIVRLARKYAHLADR